MKQVKQATTFTEWCNDLEFVDKLTLLLNENNSDRNTFFNLVNDKFGNKDVSSGDACYIRDIAQAYAMYLRQHKYQEQQEKMDNYKKEE